VQCGALRGVCGAAWCLTEKGFWNNTACAMWCFAWCLAEKGCWFNTACAMWCSAWCLAEKGCWFNTVCAMWCSAWCLAEKGCWFIPVKLCSFFVTFLWRVRIANCGRTKTGTVTIHNSRSFECWLFVGSYTVKLKLLALTMNNPYSVQLKLTSTHNEQSMRSTIKIYQHAQWTMHTQYNQVC